MLCFVGSGLPLSDIDGQPRIICRDVDMGADEYYCQPTEPNQAWCPSPKDGSAVVTEPNRILELCWEPGAGLETKSMF